MSKIKTACCVEIHRDPDATHITVELDPPQLFHDIETQRFRIIEDTREGGRQIIADNGSWQYIKGTGSSLPLDLYLARYHGYHEPLISKLRRLRGQWDDLTQPPDHTPNELRRLWGSFDALQRLLIAIMVDHMTEAVERASQSDDDDSSDWWD